MKTVLYAIFLGGGNKFGAILKKVNASLPKVICGLFHCIIYSLKYYASKTVNSLILQNERRSIYHDLCSKVQRIWEDLEEESHGYFATVCKKGDKSTPVLTKDEMTKMEKSYRQVCFSL